MATDTNIYVVGQVTPEPGKSEAYLKHYMGIYAPLAAAVGMKQAERVEITENPAGRDQYEALCVAQPDRANTSRWRK